MPVFAPAPAPAPAAAPAAISKQKTSSSVLSKKKVSVSSSVLAKQAEARKKATDLRKEAIKAEEELIIAVKNNEKAEEAKISAEQAQASAESAFSAANSELVAKKRDYDQLKAADETAKQELERATEELEKAEESLKEAEESLKEAEKSLIEATKKESIAKKTLGETDSKREEIKNKLKEANVKLLESDKKVAELEEEVQPDNLQTYSIETEEIIRMKESAKNNKETVKQRKEKLIELINAINSFSVTSASLASPVSLASPASPDSPASIEDTKKILTELSSALCELIDSKLSIYEYDTKQVTKSFNKASIHFETAGELLKGVAYELKAISSATGGAPVGASAGTGTGTGVDTDISSPVTTSAYSRIIAKLSEGNNGNKYKELIRLMLEQRKTNEYKQSTTDSPNEIKRRLEELAKKAQRLADEAPELLKTILTYLKDTNNIDTKLKTDLIDTQKNDITRKEKEREIIRSENKELKGSLEDVKKQKEEIEEVRNEKIRRKEAAEKDKADKASKKSEAEQKVTEKKEGVNTATTQLKGSKNDKGYDKDFLEKTKIKEKAEKEKEKAYKEKEKADKEKEKADKEKTDKESALAEAKANATKAEDDAEVAGISYGLVDILKKNLYKIGSKRGEEDIFTGGAEADTIDKYSDDSLKTQYIETHRYDKIDNNIINEFRKLKGEKDSGSGSKGLGRIKTDNKIEQLSNDIDVYNASSFEDKEQNRQYITRRIDAFENDPENPIEELALTFDDRIVFIVATFFIRYITIIMIQWCIDINIIKTFYEGFIYYAVIYIIIFWFVVLFINIDNSYEVKYMNFNGVINSIRTLFYYFYMGTNGISRLLIHTSLIIILIVIPIILNIKKKQELTTDDSSPQDDNMKVLNYEERKQLTKALSLFTMFIWLFTSIIATKF